MEERDGLERRRAARWRERRTAPARQKGLTAVARAMSILAVVALLAPALARDAAGQDAPGRTVHVARDHSFVVDTVVSGLEHPWGLAFLPPGDPSGDVLVTEREGRLRVVRLGEAWARGPRVGPDGEPVALPSARLDATPVSGVPDVWASGQGGLLDVALHPDFETNRWVYLSYSKPGRLGSATTAVVRGRLEGHRLVGVEEVLEADAWRRSRVHFGSRLAFDGDGYLYVTVGERGEREAAQDRSNHQGTTLRLHDDGSVPDDNPFVGVPGARPEIWTYGNRSPQGLDVHPETGELWQTEHGPRGGDELNRLRAGANYGWPEITYGINYSGSIITEDTARSGMEQPVIYWDPSIATSGLEIYDGAAFPAWRGDAFVGGLAGRILARVELDGGAAPGGWEGLLPGYARVRQVRQGPDGALWLLLDEGSSPLVRLVPAG